MLNKVLPRQNIVSWDEYFMGIALLVAQKSEDPSTIVGAVIVRPDNTIASTGYNGVMRGATVDTFPWDNKAPFVDNKYSYVVHAEANSLINAMNHNQGNINGCKVYVTLFPCNECAKLLVQAGIKEIVYYDDKYHNLDVYVVSRKIFDNAGIKYTQYVKTNREIKISL